MPRNSGKTTKLLNMMGEDPSLSVIASTYRMAQMMHKMSQQIGLDIDPDRFVAAAGVLHHNEKLKRSGKKIPVYLVDELDAVLSTLIGNAHVEAATWSPEPTEIAFDVDEGTAAKLHSSFVATASLR